jgi:hypothetical protein
MTGRPILALLLLGLGGLQLFWSGLSAWTQRRQPEVRLSEVQAEVRVKLETREGDVVRLLFPEIPLAIDQPARSGVMTIPLAFRSPSTAPTRVQVQIWRERRIALQSEPLVWAGGQTVDLGTPVLTPPRRL